MQACFISKEKGNGRGVRLMDIADLGPQKGSQEDCEASLFLDC